MKLGLLLQKKKNNFASACNGSAGLGVKTF
jgi:hypothetical protein